VCRPGLSADPHPATHAPSPNQHPPAPECLIVSLEPPLGPCWWSPGYEGGPKGSVSGSRRTLKRRPPSHLRHAMGHQTGHFLFYGNQPSNVNNSGVGFCCPWSGATMTIKGSHHTAGAQKRLGWREAQLLQFLQTCLRPFLSKFESRLVQVLAQCAVRVWGTLGALAVPLTRRPLSECVMNLSAQ